MDAGPSGAVCTGAQRARRATARRDMRPRPNTDYTIYRAAVGEELLIGIPMEEECQRLHPEDLVVEDQADRRVE